MVSRPSVLIVAVLDGGEMGRRENLSDFNHGQIIIAWWLGQSISETARAVVLRVRSGEYLLTLVRGGTNHKPTPGCWAPKAH